MHGGGFDDSHCLSLKHPMVMGSKKDTAVLGFVKKCLYSKSQFGCPVLPRWFYQVHDRGVSQALRHAISEHVTSVCSDPAGECLSGESSTTVEIHTELGCNLHDCHSAIEWKGVSKAVQALDSCLLKVLDVVSVKRCASEEVLLHTSLLAYMEEPDAFAELSSVLLSMWRYPSSVSSRWLTIGASRRCCIEGAMFGYSNCLQYMRESGFIGDTLLCARKPHESAHPRQSTVVAN
eukprot:3857474-Amphidinium_carterae.2